MILKVVAGPDVAGQRLDDGARALFPGLSGGRIRKAIEWGGCRIAGSIVRVASRPLKAGDAITIGVADKEPIREYGIAETDLLWNDAEYLAVNKPEGLYCQRTPYQLKGTVEFAVDRYLRSAGIAEPARVVHRLDRGTSGVMVFPKTRRAAAHLSERLRAGAVEKIYWALVPAPAGGPDAWTVDAPVAALGKSRFGVGPAGREARTAFRVLAAGDGAALLEARPLSGRTHQIRVHLAHAGRPVAGDDRYGGLPAPRLMLHCGRMSFDAAEGRRVVATAPVDAAFADGCRRSGIPPPRCMDP